MRTGFGMLKEQVSHYKILKKLGAGGMGEVYLAEDRRLFRQVALKFLPASYQYDPDRRARFLREARAASALRTPNAAAIYDIGEHDGLNFIVMEYVEGELLSRRIQGGALPANEALDIAIQLAEALDEAHSLGIIHRDIKSNNVIITRRQLVKLLDFGLAQITHLCSEEDAQYVTKPLNQQSEERRATPQPAASLTADLDATTLLEGDTNPTVALAGDPEETVLLDELSPDRGDPLSPPAGYASSQPTTVGRVLGTVPYMSPEQALGNPLDPRTDIFSLGVIIYEMLTGRLPFAGSTELETIQQIVSREPPPMAQFNATVSPALEAMTRKCLAKNREERFSSASELLQELHNLQKLTAPLSASAALVAPATPLKKPRARKAVDSLAILPFENASGDRDMEYLSDGITESIINHLTQLTRLKVMARSTVFRYKGKDVDPQAVGAELGVRAVVTGRVVQRGDTLVIKTELVDSTDGSQLWGEQFNQRIHDIFAVEEEIAREISEKLKLKLSGEQKRRLGKRHTENTLAYQEYLKGRYAWNKRTREGLLQSISHFNRAIDIDPNYALAYSGLADAYNIIASYSSSPPGEAFPRARSAATRALVIDNTLAEAHTSLAFVRFGYDWDWTEAEKEYRLAISLNPGYAAAHQWLALMLVALGRHQEARAEMQQALEIDPLSLVINTNWGWLLYLGRDYDEAIRQLRKTLELEPNFLLAHRRLSQAYAQRGMFAEAEAEFEKALALSGEDTETIASHGYFHAMSGRRNRAEKALEELSTISCHRYVPAYFFAKIFIGLGEADRAFKFLDMALEERYGFLAYMKVEPELDSLRSDPRFAAFIRRVGLD